ncbi:MAG: hypothetical protein P9M02_05115 [Candidatus Susulua stagnicola]|nr:hypothetical protein [Candidatus Susulua stagnicola]
MLIITLFIFGLVTRLMPHLPNFTPILAISLFAGAYFNKKYAIWFPIALYTISELIIGGNDVIFFTAGSIFLITLLGMRLRGRTSLKNNLFYGLISPIIFFLISNFGVWAIGWYPPTLIGLTQCYIMALPFLKVSILASVSYVAVLTLANNLIVNKVTNKKLAFALLLK